MHQPLSSKREASSNGKHQHHKRNKCKENTENRSQDDADCVVRATKDKDRGRSTASTTDDSTRFAPSTQCRYNLVPGHQNTTTKEPLPRPPEIRLVTSLASKGTTLSDSLHRMNMGPTGSHSSLQHLSTRDVVMVPDLFEQGSGFVYPPDPFCNDSSNKSIYERLVSEIHHASRVESHGGKGGRKGKGGGKGVGGKGDHRPEGDDANGLFKAWHKTVCCFVMLFWYVICHLMYCTDSQSRWRRTG